MSKLLNYSLLALKVAVPVALLLAGTDAFAAGEVKTLGGQMGNLEGEVEAGGSLFKTVVALGGAVLTAIGVYKIYKNQEDPRDHKLSTGLIAFLSGGALLAFTALTDMAAGTATGSTVEESEVFEKK